MHTFACIHTKKHRCICQGCSRVVSRSSCPFFCVFPCRTVSCIGFQNPCRTVSQHKNKEKIIVGPHRTVFYRYSVLHGCGNIFGMFPCVRKTSVSIFLCFLPCRTVSCIGFQNPCRTVSQPKNKQKIRVGPHRVVFYRDSVLHGSANIPDIYIYI